MYSGISWTMVAWNSIFKWLWSAFCRQWTCLFCLNLHFILDFSLEFLMQYPVSISLIFGLQDRFDHPGDFISLRDSVFQKWYDQICVPRCVPRSLRLRYRIPSRAARTRTVPSSKALLQMSYVILITFDVVLFYTLITTYFGIEALDRLNLSMNLWDFITHLQPTALRISHKLWLITYES